MKKRIPLVMLSAALALNICACEYVPQNDVREESTQGITDAADPSPNPSPGQTEPLFSDYQDILSMISLLHAQKEEGELDPDAYSALDERDAAIYQSLPHFICGGSGYCIKDVNNDGIEELIMLTEMWKLRGLFTMQNGLPILLEQCDNGGIGKDGKIRAEEIEETAESKKTVYRLKSVSGNTLTTELELEATEFFDSAKQNKYALIVDGTRTEMQSADFSILKVDHDFRDYHNLTPSAGITCTRLLDIPEQIEKGKYFSLSRLKQSETKDTYFLEIYDKDGNTVLSCRDEFLSVYEITVSDRETLVSIHYGNNTNTYYSVLENRFSETFHPDTFSVWSISGRLIIGRSGVGDAKRLVIRDIFDPEKFYRSYDHEVLHASRLFAQFSQDNQSISLKYYKENAQYATTRVLCLEELPILKTQKICYIRYESNISSECVMASSGVRAVLRADTNDTVRLLSEGAIEGGEYTSDDGTVRNDWYCIDYRGSICYVTADSFEPDVQMDSEAP